MANPRCRTYCLPSNGRAGILGGNMSTLCGNERRKMSDKGRASYPYFTGKELSLTDKTDLK